MVVFWYCVFIGTGHKSCTEPDYWHIIPIMLWVSCCLSLNTQPVTAQMYCLSTQWENIDLLSLTHLIRCVGDFAFHLSSWQSKLENAAASFFSVMKHWSIADYHIWKMSLSEQELMSFFIHGIWLALVSKYPQKANIRQPFSVHAQLIVQRRGSDVLFQLSA